MKALVYHGARDIRHETVPDPPLRDARGAIVRVTAASICGSDLHLYHGRLPVEPGFAVGHEFVGRVEEVGSEVRSVRPGAMVIVPGIARCGECASCRRGYAVGCTTQPLPVYGMSLGLPGGQAEFVSVPVADDNLIPVPAGLSDEQVVLLTDILPTGYFGARNGEVAPGDVVVVIGAGPVGLASVLAAGLFGPARILVVDRVAARLARAREFGAEPIDASAGNVEAAIYEATGGRGADVVIEAVGAEETLSLALSLVRVGGRVSIVGVFVEASMPFPIGLAFMKDVKLRIGTCNIGEYVGPLLALIESGRIDPTRLISHRLPLAEGPQAYAMFDQRRDGCTKVLLRP